MKITNKLNLPQAIVNAITNDPYNPGDCDISATRLIGPPQIRKLSAEYQDQIEEDAIDRIWALMGQSIHSVLERHGEISPDTIEEWRITGNYPVTDGEERTFKVSGQIDLIDVDEKTLWDFKVTSVWSVINGPKPEWIAQLNILADLFRKNGGEVETLKVCAILRDWTASRAIGNGYPKHQVVVVDIPLWDVPKAAAYIYRQIARHFLMDTPPCSDDERWYNGEKWAVMKQGRKSAVRLYDSREEADAHLEEAGDSKLYVEHRPGAYRRCEGYCSVARFCPQWKEQLTRKAG